MCAACIEYAKDKLTSNEFRAALKEMTLEDKSHLAEVENLIKQNQGQPLEEVKKKLAQLNPLYRSTSRK